MFEPARLSILSVLTQDSLPRFIRDPKQALMFSDFQDKLEEDAILLRLPRLQDSFSMSAIDGTPSMNNNDNTST